MVKRQQARRQKETRPGLRRRERVLNRTFYYTNLFTIWLRRLSRGALLQLTIYFIKN